MTGPRPRPPAGVRSCQDRKRGWWVVGKGKEEGRSGRALHPCSHTRRSGPDLLLVTVIINTATEKDKISLQGVVPCTVKSEREVHRIPRF